jgi:four helix bundle protein
MDLRGCLCMEMLAWMCLGRWGWIGLDCCVASIDLRHSLQEVGKVPFVELELESRSRALATDVYRVTARFPVEERFGLTREIRRSAISVGSNIAEGAGRSTDREFARFIDIAIGSLRELRFQLTVALDLRFESEESIAELIRNCDGLRGSMLRFKRTLFRR